MISVSKASEMIRQNKLSGAAEARAIDSLVSSSLAQNILADRDYPPIPRSMMDGIAIHFDFLNQTEFKIENMCRAGFPPILLQQKNSCVEIMTGAPVPFACNLVIPYEEIKIENGFARIIQSRQRKPFEFIHAQASDCVKSDLIISEGLDLNGPRIGIAASMGYSQLQVQTRPRVLVISTGDELVDVSESPEPYQLRKSNVYALQNSLKIFGFEKVDTHHLKDDLDSMIQHYQKYQSEYDYFIYSGGVSEGKFDYLPECWKRLEIEQIFHKVSQKPGKPMWFGKDHKNQKLIFGLPGNPISSLVCLHRYILPQTPIKARLSEDFYFDKNLTYFLPVRTEVNEDAVVMAHPIAVKNSGEFVALAKSNGFIELPAEKNQFLKNECYPFYSWKPGGFE